MSFTLKARAAAVLLALALGGCASVQTGPDKDGEQVIAEGMAPFNGNMALARANAIAAAQESAVEQVVGVFVSGSTRVQDAVAVSRKLMAGTQGFVKRYKILNERQEAGYYTVKIKAVVKVSDISSALDKMRDGARTAAVFSVETMDGRPGSSSDAASAAGAALSKAGYDIVAANAPANAADAASALDAASSANADFAVTVAADSYKVEPMPELGGGLAPYRARAAVRVYSAASRKLVAESVKEASALDAAPAVAARRAAAAAAELAAKDLPARLERAAAETPSITLKITGLTGLEQLRRFQDMLRAVPRLEKISLTSYSNGDARFLLRARDLSGDELAAMLLRQNPPFAVYMQSMSQRELALKANY
ncbi:MAG: hypothetical protein WC421_03625 [Elusimicrobiales bacterium]